MGQPELAADEYYATEGVGGANQVKLDSLINAWTFKLTIDQL
jgi:crotonobetainyl-CoA:carnitine CoA-transferase CaiB-like acyl-CoA transferase